MRPFVLTWVSYRAVMRKKAYVCVRGVYDTTQRVVEITRLTILAT